ncbi:Mrp/NBP35 family ATP-binding protein [Candidatus Methylacidithermus pantelleriae]|nr:Mrp/NBP35 family ATP-binding protein [Candidatus Methylacidithermus pantelleriae]
MAVGEEEIRRALKQVRYPGFSRDIVSFGIVKSIAVDGPRIRVELEVRSRDPKIPGEIEKAVHKAVSQLPGVERVEVILHQVASPASQVSLPQEPVPGVRHVVAVASGKGGVGKSTVAVNLAVAMRLLGPTVGLCDCDIYGPSLALMLGTREYPMVAGEHEIYPVEQYGLKLMSMGLLVEEDRPAVLRGPMVSRYTQQFLRDVRWGPLDVLVLDLPPGTGDIQLTIVQTVSLSGAIVVTTPQEVALLDARKAVAMFQKVQVPVLGIIENMSYFLCPGDGKGYPIFGSGGGRREAARLGVPLLAEIPLEIPLRESGDQGVPIVLLDPEAPSSCAFREAAKKVIDILEGG